MPPPPTGTSTSSRARLTEPAPNLLFRLFVAGQLAGALLGRAIEPSGLKPNEFAVLSIIGAYQPVGPTELSRRAGMPATTISDHVARLEARGLVDRSPDPDDRRASLLELTAEGRRCNELAIDGLIASNRAVATGLDVEPESVRAALDELEAALRKEDGSAA
jgi:DNA-binding MarR family transcriptional regulator